MHLTRRELFFFFGGIFLACRALRAEPQRILNVEVDDLPLLGPYLLPTVTPYDSIRVLFRSTEPSTFAADGVLSYGLKSPDEKKIPFTAAAKHELTLLGLAPNTVYQYQLKLGTYVSPIYHFRTAPALGSRGEKAKVLIISDFHVNSPKDVADKRANSENFYRRYGEKADDMRKFQPDLVLLPGDIVHVGGRREEFETLLRLMRDIFATATVLPCPGNHERQEDNKLSNYADFFPDPVPTRHTGAWAVAYGGIGFVTHGTDQWLETAIADLKTTGKTDTIFYTLHAPPYLWCDKQTYNTANAFSKIFDAAGDVSLCIAGHFHMPQRTFPLLANAATTTEKSTYGPDTKGTIYLQIPSIWYQYAFAKDDPLVAHNAEMSKGGYITGFTEMTITPDKILTETYGYSETAQHELIDQFTILRKPLQK